MKRGFPGLQSTILTTIRNVLLLLMFGLAIVGSFAPDSWATPNLELDRQTVPTRTPVPPPTDPPPPPPTNPPGPQPTNPPEATITATSAAPTQDPSCLDAAYVADVTIPDNTRIEAGSEFVKTWRVLNDGTCPWPPETVITFESGDILGAAASSDVGALETGQTTDISVTMVAPTADGSYQGVWRLADQNGTKFGTFLTVLIQVGEPTPTSSPQPTSTAAPTAPPQASPTGVTVTPTATHTATATVTPTASATPAATATETPTPAVTASATPTASPTPTPSLTATPEGGESSTGLPTAALLLGLLVLLGGVILLLVFAYRRLAA